MMYKQAIIHSVGHFAISIVGVYIMIILEVVQPFPSVLIGLVIVAPMSLLYGIIIFYMTKMQYGFRQLVEDNLHSEIVGEYLSGNLSAYKLKKILREKGQ